MTAILELPQQKQPSLLDLKLPEGYAKSEIVGGALIMSPLRGGHNETIWEIVFQLRGQISEELWFLSDVLTPFPLEEHQFCPDLVLVPRALGKSNPSICPPDSIELAVEVVSPSTADIDYKIKLGAYARAGIAEYLIFDMYARSVIRYAELEDGEYTLRQVVHYGKPVHIQQPGAYVIETADLPVDPKQQD